MAKKKTFPIVHWIRRVFTVECLQSNSSEGEAFRLLPLWGIINDMPWCFGRPFGLGWVRLGFS